MKENELLPAPSPPNKAVAGCQTHAFWLHWPALTPLHLGTWGGSHDSSSFREDSDPTSSSIWEAEGEPRALPEPLSSGRKHAGELQSRRTRGCRGTFHLKDCLVSTTTLWLPEVPPPCPLPGLTPAGCTWNRCAWPRVWTWGLPRRTRGGGSRASAEGARNVEALLRPLRGGGGGMPLGARPLGPYRSQSDTS